MPARYTVFPTLPLFAGSGFTHSGTSDVGVQVTSSSPPERSTGRGSGRRCATLSSSPMPIGCGDVGAAPDDLADNFADPAAQGARAYADEMSRNHPDLEAPPPTC